MFKAFKETFTVFGWHAFTGLGWAALFATLAHIALPGAVPLVWVWYLWRLCEAQALSNPEPASRAANDPLPPELARYEEDFK